MEPVLFFFFLGVVLAALSGATLVAAHSIPKTNPYHKPLLKSGLLLLGCAFPIAGVCNCLLFPENPVVVFIAAVFGYLGWTIIRAIVSGEI